MFKFILSVAPCCAGCSEGHPVLTDRMPFCKRTSVFLRSIEILVQAPFFRPCLRSQHRRCCVCRAGIRVGDTNNRRTGAFFITPTGVNLALSLVHICQLVPPHSCQFATGIQRTDVEIYSFCSLRTSRPPSAYISSSIYIPAKRSLTFIVFTPLCTAEL